MSCKNKNSELSISAEYVRLEAGLFWHPSTLLECVRLATGLDCIHQRYLNVSGWQPDFSVTSIVDMVTG
jgi:hypothetical protein